MFSSKNSPLLILFFSFFIFISSGLSTPTVPSLPKRDLTSADAQWFIAQVNRDLRFFICTGQSKCMGQFNRSYPRARKGLCSENGSSNGVFI